MTQSPPPLSMAEGAVAAHELFMSYVDAGFTREEALEIVKALLAGAAGGKL